MKKPILDKWNIAKARVHSGEGRAVHLVLGDSMTMGTGAGSGGSGNHIDAYPHSYPNDLATLMREKLLLTANNNWLGDQGINAATSGSVTPAQYDPRIAPGPQWGFGPDEILAGRFIVFNPGSGTDVLSFTPEEEFDNFEITYPKFSLNGASVVDVDGGSSLGTINAFNATPGVGTDGFVVTKGNHTINITAQDDGYFPVMAIKCWDSTIPAVELFQAGVYGASVGYFTVNTNPWSPLNGFDYVAPDLTTICLTINDAANLTPISDYVGLLSVLIEKAQLTGDVQLVSGIPYNGVTSTDGTHNAIIASMKLLAEQYSCVFVDLNARWESFALLNPLGYYDPVTDHASRAGQYDIAAIVLESL